MKAVLEGILFVVGDEGVTINDICNILEINEEDAKKLVLELKNDYLDCNRGLRIDYLGNSIKLTTKKEHKYFYEKYVEKDSVKTLSQSALETLAIIAYNEPITRAQVDELRGINSSQMIRNLIAKDFVKELGKSTLPGRPNLYGITNQFLDYFGLSSKEDLPKLEDITTNEDDVDLYESRYKEVEVEEL